MWNLLKILNKDKCLDGLNSIDEVYDSQVNIIEEILYYHNYKEKLNKNQALGDNNDSMNSSRISALNDEDDGPNMTKIKNIYNPGGTKKDDSSVDS